MNSKFRMIWTMLIAASVLSLVSVTPVRAQADPSATKIKKKKQQESERLKKAIAAKRAKAAEEAGEKTDGTKTEPASAGQPKVVADEMVHDFGTTWAGDPLKHSFVLRNEGDAPLRILSVKPSCGCTKGGKMPDSIAPGESGEFPFSLRSTKLRAHYRKNIRVQTNDPNRPTLNLQLQGSCKQYVDMDPGNVFFSNVSGTDPVKKRVTITNNTEKPLELTLPPAKPKADFKYALTEKEPGKIYELTVTMEPPFNEGIQRDLLAIKTNSIRKPKLDLRVTSRVPERLKITPDKVVVNPMPKSVPRPLVFRNSGGEPVKVLSATSSDPKLGTALEVKERKAGKEYIIKLDIPANYTPAPGTKITIMTDDAKKPQMVIPVSQRSRPVRNRVRPFDTMSGKPAPAFSLSTVEGKPFTSDEFASNGITVIDFFAGNCHFCQKQIPRVESIREEYAKKGVRFVAVAQTMRKVYTEAQLKQVTKSKGWKGELALNTDNTVGRAWKATSYPSLAIVDKQGKIHATHVGNKATLENDLRRDLNYLIKNGGISNTKPGENEKTASSKPAKPMTKPAGKPVEGNLRRVNPKDIPALRKMIEERKAKEQKKAEPKKG